MILRTVLGVLAAGMLCSGAETFDRTKPPATPPIRDFKLPPVYETKLPNGLSVVLVDDRRFPLVTVRLSMFAGSKSDPKDLPGLAESVSALLTEGTNTRTSRQIAEELAGIGGSLNGGSNADAITLAGSALAEHTGKLLEVLSDVARNANFPANEVQLRKQNRKQELLAERSESAFLATEKLNSVLFNGHPYGHIVPTIESLDRLDRESLAQFRDTQLAPNNAVLILVGRLPSQSDTLNLIQTRFGDWKPSQIPAVQLGAPPEAKRQLFLVDRPGSVQADIHMGELAITRADPDYFPLLIANTILGGSFSSRMFNNIREKQGYAYDAHSELDRKREAGAFIAVTQVRNEVLEPALQAVIAEMQGMSKEPVSAAELSDAKNFLGGVFLIGLETQSGLAEQLNIVKTMGLPNDYLERYTSRVRAVTPEQIQAVARKYFAPDRAAIVVVGDAAKISKSLEKFGPVQVTKASQ